MDHRHASGPVQERLLPSNVSVGPASPSMSRAVVPNLWRLPDHDVLCHVMPHLCRMVGADAGEGRIVGALDLAGAIPPLRSRSAAPQRTTTHYPVVVLDSRVGFWYYTAVI